MNSQLKLPGPSCSSWVFCVLKKIHIFVGVAVDF
ncbi:hypothetical protein DERP_009868 [Dermatophagoides pteronyssinus]|uniref:Uncharacterized protein n=1 Tax=Dermatophagoides pteronyssinus TaxID=6956 RepID=A0ABQ8IRR6_DERPT|nr:hypothetical protein DERP_009868 [Dermatophagoides pteronyssinus]